MIRQKLSVTEENYLKAIFHLAQKTNENVATNDIAKSVSATAASVTDMLKKLSEKKLVTYQKYQGVQLTKNGKLIAIKLVRKHRLWEVFLSEKLGFGWDKVHDIAEQLEHIQSDELTEKLSNFLGNPQYDPHGDPIPNESGKFSDRNSELLCNMPIGAVAKVVGVIDSSNDFLVYLSDLKISLGTKITVKKIITFDKSMEIMVNKNTIIISKIIASNILVVC